MEPMTLGSPGGSPAPSPYLPSFLMGSEPQAPPTPRTNTLSPPGGRNISFATSPTSPQDYNRSGLGQRTLFSGYQTSPVPGSGIGNFPTTPMQSHNASMSGPPTQGLFDSLRNERNQVQTPTRATPQQTYYDTPIPQQHFGAFGMNKSHNQHQQFNDSYINNASFNGSRSVMSPLSGPSAGSALNSSHMLECPPIPRYTEFWVTVYGFPPSTTSTILQHFAQCGTIVDKVFPPQNGNWVHLKYTSRLECDKALNYNEKILGNNIMIGVTSCKDKNIIDKENLCDNSTTQPCKVRPLAQTAYKTAQNDSAVVACPNAPQKSSGLMNKAMDLFFGW